MHGDAWAPVIAGHVDMQLHLAAVATAAGKDTFSKGPWEPQEGAVPFPRWLSAACELQFWQMSLQESSGTSSQDKVFQVSHAAVPGNR